MVGIARPSRLRAVLTHELGHLFGLGHCVSDAAGACAQSVMRTDILELPDPALSTLVASKADRACLKGQLSRDAE